MKARMDTSLIRKESTVEGETDGRGRGGGGRLEPCSLSHQSQLAIFFLLRYDGLL